ncbi:MAG: UvrD-helicase domain-containing protein [Bacteroidales bacterium]|nr:UvrD-helicase domain-containing protein [Bacteroidales bacterium]
MSELNVINASAGSGKTHRITFEFIKSILPDPNNAGRILAITFTNKAAGEMKERIVEELSKLSSSPGESKMEGDLKNDLNIKNEELQTRAQAALKFILHHYSDLSVSTIDSFIQRIIRTFSRDLGLASDYEVLIDDSEMSEYIIDSIIDKVNVDKEMTEVFKQVIERNLENDNLSLNFKDSLNAIVKNLGKESADDFIKEVTQHNTSTLIGFMKKAYAEVSAQRKNITKELGLFDEICKKNNLTDESFNKHYTKLNIEVDKIRSQPEKYELKSRTETLINEKGILVEQNETIETELRDLFLSLCSDCNKLAQMQVLVQDFPYVAIIAEILRIREDFKSSEGILPVSDFYTLIANVLANEPVPFIFLRAGNRYKSIMIDEFQDTSLMQWINLTSLIHNSLSSGNRNWLVGDPKQSIYRWRNGEMEIMLSLPKIYNGGRKFEVLEDAAPIFDSSFKAGSLDTNYRSDKNIVDFNNSFFNFIHSDIISKQVETSFQNKLISSEEKDEYLKIYKEVAQNPHKKDGGYIEISFNEEKDPNSHILHDKIEKLIQNKLEQGFKLNDIAILCRKKKSGVAISNYLLNLHTPIQVISEETLQFQSSYYCRLAMNILRVLSCEEDKLAQAEFNTLMLQIPEQNSRELFQKYHSEQKTLLSPKEYIFSQWPDMKPKKGSYYSPAELLMLIIHSMNLSEEGKHYLIFLREKVLEQERKTGSDFEAMYQWWMETGRNLSVVTPAGSNAVHIMTLHKAKGLQFPIVILPDFNFDDAKKLHSNLHWFKPENNSNIPFTAIHYSSNSPVEEIRILHQREMMKTLIDSINLVYVGCTRAENELFVFSDIDKKSKEKIGEKVLPGVMLYHYLENNSKSDKANFKFNEVKAAYSFGESVFKKESDSEKNQGFTLRHFHATHPHAYREESADFDSEILRESAKEGRIWHEILSKIEKTEEAKKLIQQYVLNGQVPFSKQAESIIFLEELVDKHPDIFPKNARLLNERDITDEKGFIHRPDRIIKQGESYTVIDFKTGTPKESHKKQVAEYRDILKSMGLNVKRTCLLYLRPGEGESEVVDI